MICYHIFKDTPFYCGTEIITCVMYVICVISGIFLWYVGLRGIMALVIQKILFSDWVCDASNDCILDVPDEHMFRSAVTQVLRDSKFL